jgi:hypothetical protein
MGDMGNPYRILVVKAEMKMPFRQNAAVSIAFMAVSCEPSDPTKPNE